jgi:pyruvate formate lyase activating enzyme
MVERKALIFNIQKYNMYDGPGVRTLIFFKGCPLRCYWCHNPESIHPQPELMYESAKCIGCGRCGDRLSGACADNCPSGALTVSGKNVTVEELLQTAEKDNLFYQRSGGGITVSGGEALLQPVFAAAFLAACRENGWHTAVDTAGEVPFSAFEAVLPYTELFLYDIKVIDPARHTQGCGTDNRRILDNLRRLSALGAEIRLRVPVVPGFNDDEAAMAEIGAFTQTLPRAHPLDLLRFHRMGAVKYKNLRRTYPANDITPPDDTRMRALADSIKRQGVGEVIIY